MFCWFRIYIAWILLSLHYQPCIRSNYKQLYIYIIVICCSLFCVVIVSFPLDDEPDVSMLAWTTTPWTLPSNLALVVNPKLDYVKAKGEQIIFTLKWREVGSLLIPRFLLTFTTPLYSYSLPNGCHTTEFKKNGILFTSCLMNWYYA